MKVSVRNDTIVNTEIRDEALTKVYGIADVSL